MASVTDQEVTQYDRQIRLWGLEAQNRLRGSKIMLFGIGPLGGEICKNLVLAGIGEMNICDPNPTQEKTLLMTNGTTFPTRAEASRARVEELNPRVVVNIIPGSMKDKNADDFSGFNLVIITDIFAKEELVRISNICRKKNIKVIIGAQFGLYGIGFNDLLDHEYAFTIDSGETNKSTTNFCAFEDSIASPDPKISKREAKRNFLMPLHAFKAILESSCDLKNQDINSKYGLSEDIVTNCIHSVPPVAAVIGGILGQEAIKAIGLKEPPIDNWFLFNGDQMRGSCIKI